MVSNSVWPYRRQATRLPRPWDYPGKNTGVGCHFLLQCVNVKSESEVAQLCPTCSNPMNCSLPAPPSMGFSRQEYWSGLPSPFPTDRLDASCSRIGSARAWGGKEKSNNNHLTISITVNLQFPFKTPLLLLGELTGNLYKILLCPSTFQAEIIFPKGNKIFCWCQTSWAHTGVWYTVYVW